MKPANRPRERKPDRRFVMRAAGFGLGLLLLAGTAAAQDYSNLEMAQRLVAYSGGVSVFLRQYGETAAAKTAAPDAFRQAFLQAMTDNHEVIAKADAEIAAVDARLYSARELTDELAFYDSAAGQAILAKFRDGLGRIIWPTPDDTSLTGEQRAALTKFNRTVKDVAAKMGQDPDAAGALLDAEGGAVIKIRQAAYQNYCKTNDCAKEGIVPPK